MGLYESYRLHAAILAIYNHDDKRIPIMVPEGALVSVSDGPLNGSRMIDVLWDEKSVTIFSVDLKARGKLIRSVKTKSANT